MTGAYHQLRVHVSHRAAAGLSGVSRATAHRRAVLRPPRPPVARRAPVNRLSTAERTRILAVLNSDRFVVCIALLVGIVSFVIAAALPHSSWVGRVKAGAAAFAVAVPIMLVTMTAAGFL
jgi:hypothetical protein